MSLEIHLAHLAKRVDDLEATLKRVIDGLAESHISPLTKIAEQVGDFLSKVKEL